MLFLSIVHHYLLWHYSRAFYEIFHVWLNLLWFVIHFFSMPQLLRTWVSPWKRMVEGKGEAWNFEDLAGYIIINFLSRLVGFIMRTAILVSGLVSLIFTAIAGFIVYVFWIVAPVAIVGLFVSGIGYLISSLI